MKRILALVFSVCVTFSLAACGSAPKDTTAENLTAPITLVTPETDYLTIYSGILANAHSILVDPDARTDFAPGEMGLFEAANVLGDEASDTVGYVLKDIDGNGVPELLVGVFEKPDFAYTKNELYAVYTCKESTPALLLESNSRNAYSLMDNGSLFYSGSGGAIYRIFGEFLLADAGMLISKSYYFTYEKNEDGSEIGYYYNTAGEWDPAVSQELDLRSEDEFWAIEKQLATQTVTLQDTKFAQLQLDV